MEAQSVFEAFNIAYITRRITSEKVYLKYEHSHVPNEFLTIFAYITGLNVHLLQIQIT